MEYIENFVNMINNNPEYSGFIFGCIICFGIPLSFIIVKIFDKLLSDKLKIIIEKTLIVGGIIILLLTLYCSFFSKKYELFFVFIFLTFGIFVIEWTCFTKHKRLVPNKYVIKQKNEKEFNDFLQHHLLKNNYNLIDEIDGTKIYKCEKTRWRDSFFAIINSDLMIEEDFSKKYQLLYDYVLENSKSWKYNKTANLILIVTVNKTNTVFNGYCSEFVCNSLRFNILSTGVSFGGKKLYIPNTVFTVPTLNKLKKQLIKMLELEKCK